MVERDELIDLQRLLLPSSLPAVGCTEVAAAYRSHNHDFRLGGDWYDIIDRSDNQVVAIVGDVVGHGVEQIAVMGQLRAATNALGRFCAEPHELLSYLDAFACDLPGAAMATIAVVMLDGTHTARIASAGHPPIIHVRTDGSKQIIELGRRTPLTIPAPQAATATFGYEVDDLVVMFTDGLIERRGSSFDSVMAEVADFVSERRNDACADIAAALVDGYAVEAEDDIALLVLRPRNHRAPDHLLRRLDEPVVLIG